MDTIKNILAVIVSMSTVIGIFSKIVSDIFSKKLKPIEDKIEKHRLTNLRVDMEEWRYHIVSFASELREGVHKSKFEYDSIFVFIDEYEKAVEELGVNNGLFEIESQFIKQKYNESTIKDY